MPWCCPAGDATVHCPAEARASPAGMATAANRRAGVPSDLCRSRADSVACQLETQLPKPSPQQRSVRQEKLETELSWRSPNCPAAHIQIATDRLQVVLIFMGSVQRIAEIDQLN